MSWNNQAYDNARKRTNNITVSKSTFLWMTSVAYSDYNKKQRIKRFLIRVKRKVQLRHESIINAEIEKLRKERELVDSIYEAQYKMFENC